MIVIWVSWLEWEKNLSFEDSGHQPRPQHLRDRWKIPEEVAVAVCYLNFRYFWAMNTARETISGCAG